MKATGAEIKQFWDEWPPGERWYNDDSELDVYSGDEQRFLLVPEVKYDLAHFGILVWQGPDGLEIPKDPPMRGSLDVSFESWFKHWKKGKISTSFSVLVKNEDVEAFQALAKQHGWKVA